MKAEYRSIIGDLSFSVCLPKVYAQNLGLDKGGVCQGHTRRWKDYYRKSPIDMTFQELKAGSIGGKTSEPADRPDSRYNDPVVSRELYRNE